MYNDKNIRKAHFKDFQRVLARVEKEPDALDYRIKVLKDCIDRCKE